MYKCHILLILLAKTLSPPIKSVYNYLLPTSLLDVPIFTILISTLKILHIAPLADKKKNCLFIIIFFKINITVKG